jgi:homoserine kinase
VTTGSRPESSEGRTVQVRVPATSANLGPGFDTLGLALSVYDDLTVTALGEGELEIEVEGQGATDVPRDASHLVVRAVAHAYASVDRRMPGLHLHARNVIPHGRGMGSSGAAVVSGLLAAKGLLEGDVHLSDDDLLRLATELEGHPDNVAPALFGGLTIAWMTPEGPRH